MLNIKKPARIFFLLFISCCIFIFAAGQKAKVQSFSQSDIENAMGGKVKAEFKTLPIIHVEITKDSVKAFLFNTGDIPNISQPGFNKKSVVDVFILCDSDGKVISAFLGDNSDTPGHVQRVTESQIFKNWQGKKNGDKAPDSVTKATFTSKAINDGILALLKKLQGIKFFEGER